MTLESFKRQESLYEGRQVTVSRGTLGDSPDPVIVKQVIARPDNALALAQLRYEHRLLLTLNDPPCAQFSRPLQLLELGAQVALVLEDIGAYSLATWRRKAPLSLAELLDAASQVATALTRVHRAQIVHKDINPANIVYNRDSRRAQLIDFGIAAQVPRELQAVDSLKAIEGTMAYISPEQSGRLNRLLDYRSDFYSLGVTLYELLAGELPFSFHDVSEQVYATIARTPPPLAQRAPNVPPAVVAVVEKLLQKAPEDRYQSAQGLWVDLQRCAALVAAGDAGSTFVLGSLDHSERFDIPQRLYGREADVGHILTAYEGTLGGKSAVVLLTGPSGIGKSALVQELQSSMVKDNTILAQGKYDQVRRHVPFSALGQAVGGVIRRILREGDATVDSWRRRCQEAVGSVGQALLDIAPAAELLIGKQPRMPELPPRESENRLLLMLLRFMRTLCKRNPLVLFLDDLQWADSSTLKLLRLMAVDDQPGAGLLIMGAYRNTEVGPDHPLADMLRALQQQHVPVQILHVSPMQETPLTDLVCDTTRASRAVAQPLARLILRKTAGTPFFVHEFLKHLWKTELVRYEAASNAWAWDLAAIEAADVTDNVVTLMTQQLRTLAPEAQGLLSLAACAGSEFNLQTLELASNLSRADLAERLAPALDANLLVPLARDYRYIAHTHNDVRYKFAHDRIQQAAYELLPVAQAQAHHHALGTRLLAQVGDERPEAWVFGVVDHLNAGAACVADDAERRRLIDLNLVAAKEGKRALACDTALAYLRAAEEQVNLLPAVDRAPMWRDVMLEMADNEYFLGNFASANARLERLLQAVKTPLEQGQVLYRKVVALRVVPQAGDALALGVDALRVLGLRVPRRVGPQHLLVLLLRIAWQLRGRTMEQLADGPKMQDERAVLMERLLDVMQYSAYVTDPLLFLWLSLHNLYLFAVYGVWPQLFGRVMATLVIVNGMLGRHDTAKRLGVLSRAKLVEYPELRNPPILQLLVFTDYVHDSAEQIVQKHYENYQTAVEQGDIENMPWLVIAVGGMLVAISLSRANLFIEQRGVFFEGRHELCQWDVLCAQRQFIRCSLGLTRDPLTWDEDGVFDMASSYKKVTTRPDTNFGAFASMRTMSLWVHRGLPEAVDMVDRVLRISIARCMDPHTAAGFYAIAIPAVLQHAGSWRALPRRHRALVRGGIRHLDGIAAAGGAGYDGAASLFRAEVAASRGNLTMAMHYYEKAMPSMRRLGYLLWEAAAYDCAARFFHQHQMHGCAEGYVHRAMDAYSRWGGTVKPSQLRREFASYLVQSLVSAPVADRLTTTQKSHLDEEVDLPQLIEASQALSSELELEQLVPKIMASLLSTAGATRAMLFLQRNDALEAVADSAPSPEVPRALVQFVARSKETLVLDDPAISGAYKDDPYIRRAVPKSILCSPILRQGRFMGLIYLENVVTSHAFTAGRLATVRVLAAQAAISLENAHLIGNLEETVQRRTVELREVYARLVKVGKEQTEMQLAGGFAHEMRNALFPARMMLEHINVNVGEADASTHTAAQAVDTAIERALHITGKIMDYAQVARLAPTDDSVVLQQVLQQLHAEFNQRFTDLDIRCELHVPEGACVRARGEHVQIMLRNLLANACDAMANLPPQRARLLHVQVEVDGDRVCTRVQDSGTGIDERVQERMFEPFFSTKGVQGTGLGLGLSRKLAEVYGGTLDFHSHPERGTAFELRLPGQH